MTGKSSVSHKKVEYICFVVQFLNFELTIIDIYDYIYCMYNVCKISRDRQYLGIYVQNELSIVARDLMHSSLSYSYIASDEQVGQIQ